MGRKEKNTDEIKDEDLLILQNEESKDFMHAIKNNRSKAQKAFKGFVKGMGNEAKETKEASLILYKFLRGEKISKDEEHELKTQVYDLFKMVGIGIPFFMIPGSSLLLPFLIKIANRFNVNLLPTSFSPPSGEEE